MNVLFIGNSYTHYNNMPGIFENIAVSKGVKIHVEMSAKSNHSLRMHCNRPEMFEKIRSRKWDYVVVQGFSRELLHEPTYLDTSFVPFLKKISDSIYASNPCTNILLNMTWGYKTGIIDNPQFVGYDSYQKMNDAIQIGYQYIGNKFGYPMVPVGQVWETVKENNPLINLYQEDNQHPSIFGSYLIACTFYSAIIKASPEGSFVATGIDDKTASIIQHTAYTFVNMNVNRYNLRLNTLDVKYEVTTDSKYVAKCRSHYPKAKSVKWDFGDGTSSDLPDIDHYYKNAGEYMVTLVVNDECGVRKVLRKVTFKPVKTKKTTKKQANNKNKDTSSTTKPKSKTSDSDSTKQKKN